jgi:hypothetical protein
MSEGCYEFDPCTLDESQDDEEVTLDNWKPSPKKKGIIKSEWRQKQIGTNFNQQPGIDDLRKIEVHLKKNKSDADIMSTFGINAQTLIAIKKNKYCPIDGISMDNLSKIYSEFKSIRTAIVKLQRSANYFAEILFIEKEDLKKYRDHCNRGMATKRTKGTKGAKGARGTKKKKVEMEEIDTSEEE